MGIPDKAHELLGYIGTVEAPRGYDTIYGNNQKKLKKQVTKMTLKEILKEQPSWTRKYGSSATGRYQFMHRTLKGLQKELDLNLNAKFTKTLQDKLGFHLLKRRGYDRFMAKEMSVVFFGKNLAKEWASFPVLKDTNGAHRQIKRGQSYYAGDGVNKALVSPESIEKLLNGLFEPVKVPMAEHWLIRLFKLLFQRKET